MKYNLSTQPYKGTRDFYPEDMRIRNWMFEKMRSVCRSYGYEEYDGPMLESFDIYAAKTGEEIVKNELYSFEDRGGRKVAMRPEMTPTVARMVAAKVQELPKPLRWFSIPNLWRYEAPQRGRLREHWQLNVDSFGIEGLDIDVEIIEVARDILLSYGATEDMFECRINNRKLLDAAFSKIGINDEMKYKVSKAIDKKDKISYEAFDSMLRDAECSDEQITKINDYLSGNLENVKELVGEEEIGYQELVTLLELLKTDDCYNFIKFDPGLMRGFDYYTGTIFEFYDKNPENRRSMFGGGRYDDLVSIFNGQKLTGFGFGMGDVTMRDFLEVHGLLPDLKSETDILVCTMDVNTKSYSLEIAKQLRNMGFNVATYLTIDKLDKQLKYANQKGIRYVVIAGDLEVSKNTFKLKDMNQREEREIKLEDIENLKL